MHYPNKDESKYTDIKEISAINEEQIHLAKSEHEIYTDKNFRQEECASILNEINDGRQGVYLEPCYKQFALSLAKSKQKLPEKTQGLSGKLSSPAGKET